jgi:hypothetical protein
VTLERINPSHIPLLYAGIGFPENNKIIDWIIGFPHIHSENDLSNHIFGSLRDHPDLSIYAIKADKSHLGPPSPPGVHPHTNVLGILGYRLHPSSRVMKLDDFVYSPVLQNTYAATEANHLLLQHLFEKQTIAYYRLWMVSNTSNIKSRRAAERIGFKYEGTFRKDNVTRWGTRRDSDCLSILDDEWPLNKAVLEKWLLASNFEANGKQIKSLDDIRNLEIKSEITAEASSQ